MYIGSNNFIDVTFFNSASSHPGNNTIKSEWILFMNQILPCYAIYHRRPFVHLIWYYPS